PGSWSRPSPPGRAPDPVPGARRPAPGRHAMADALDDLKAKVRALREEFERTLAEVRESAAVQGLRDRFLGPRSGSLTSLMKTLGGLADDAPREAGRRPDAPQAPLGGAPGRG